MENQIKLYRGSSFFIGIAAFLCILAYHGANTYTAGLHWWWIHLVAGGILIALFIYMAEVPYVRTMGKLIYVRSSLFREKTFNINLIEEIEINNPNTLNPKLILHYENGELHLIKLGILGKKGRGQLIRYIEELKNDQGENP